MRRGRPGVFSRRAALRMALSAALGTALGAALLGVAAVPAAALDWPVASRVVTGNFGESRGDHFHLGIDLGGGRQEVFPVLAGELVFRYEENEDFTSLPRGVGSFAVLRHAGSVLSIYAHLERDSLHSDRALFSTRDPIGVTGDTGASEGRHLHLEIYDGETRSFVNPRSLLPPLPDHQTPSIRKVMLRIGDRTFTLTPEAVVPAGRAEVLLEAWDAREDVTFRWPMAPYAVRLSLNGKEISRIVFDAVEERRGRMTLRGTDLGASEVYASGDLVRLGTVELRGGQSHLLATVRDFAGNEASRELFFSVRE